MTGAAKGRVALLLLVAGTFFMEIMDGTILATAAPTIARSFGVNSSAIGVAITGYLLTLAVLIPMSGWLSDRFGSRPVFLTAIALFTVASVLCATSMSLPELTAWRVLQGVGGAMMVPVGRLMVLRSTEKKDLIRSIAWLTWPALTAPVIAPLIGGVLTTAAGWQWIFIVNVPIGVLAFVVGLVVLPNQKEASVRPLDWRGLALGCVGLGSLTALGAVLAEEPTPWMVAIGLAAGGIVFTVLAVVHLLHAENPLVDLSAFRIETFRISNTGGSLYRMTISAIPFLVPLFFQDALGWSPVQSGAVLLFLFVGNLVIKPTTTPLLHRFGFRPVLIVATAGAALSMLLTSFVSDATPIAVLILLMLFSGATRSVGFTAYGTVGFADVPSAEMTSANTLSATVQQLAAAFGIALGAVALRLGEPIAGLFGAGQVVTAPYAVAFGIVGLLTIVATVEAVVMNRNAGDNIRPAQRTR